MPEPKPSANEDHDAFMERCMGDSMMNHDYPDQDQRLAVCSRQWDGKASGDVQRKFFKGVELKADKPGSFIARIATLDVIDKDGDVTLAGAFPVGKTILISAYQHASWSGELPVGKGIIRESGNEVFVDGEFNLNTASGKEHYEAIKFAPDLQEWSYGFKVMEIDDKSPWNDNPKVWRVMKKLDVFEASPVLRGAGVNTATLAVKTDKNHGQTLADETGAALAAVQGVIARVKSLADLRRGEGKAAMSESNHDRMMRMMSQMGKMMHDMQEMMDEMEPDDGKAAEAGKAELLRLLRTQSEILEVI